MIPNWLHVLSLASLSAGALCAIIVAGDVSRRPQAMAIMNVVWPVTALFGSGAILWLYFRYGQQSPHKTTLAVAAAKAACHCGAGCTLGDICAEWLGSAFPAIPVALGWYAFGDRMLAMWVLDYLLAYSFGILFQYFTIAPMRGLGLWHGLAAAIKADTLSLTAWQIGMYGFMALAQFYLFQDKLGMRLAASSVEFWFMMQVAMLCGFITAYPVNWWLIRRGLKEAM